jgi:complexin-1/2
VNCARAVVAPVSEVWPELQWLLVFQYNIKKREELQEQIPQEEPNPLMRKKKTPEELAREAEAEEEDEFTSKTGSGRTPHNTLSQPSAGETSGAETRAVVTKVSQSYRHSSFWYL